MNSDFESASEAEDSVSSPQLEQISKDQMYQAYRNSLEKLKKYRGKFTELARKYRELEKDNAKARQVLVETQDKALRRISELREQCQLEQQAKSHLESALRLEIDDLQCMNQTLHTKLELRAEDSDLLNDRSLINLSSDVDTSGEQDNLIAKLEQDLKELQCKYALESNSNQSNEQRVIDLTAQLEHSLEEIKRLKEREEENTIMIAENKMMIHSELDNKESEVKSLREKVTGLEKTEVALVEELQALKDTLAKKENEFKVVSKDKITLEDRLKEVFAEKQTVNTELSEIKDKIEKVNSKFKTLSEDKTSLQSQNELLNIEIKRCKDEMKELQQQKTSLNEEIKSVAESSKLTLEESMKSQASQLENRISEATVALNKTIEEKSSEILQCRAKIESLKNERRDHEKTLEREIREKNELKTQVTNILQEIGRLEEQLKEVRTSHSSIQVEKQKLEEKIEKIQRQQFAVNHESKILKELEAKLLEVQCENSQLAEKNCLLEESSRRISDDFKSSESQALRDENSRLVESLRILEEKVMTLNDQLTQCSGDHAKLYDEKEQLDHKYRSVQDDNETKEKEKLCLIEDLKELDFVKARILQLEGEKSNLTECCDNLRVVVENIKTENDAMIKTRDELQKSFDKMKVEFSNQARLRTELETTLKQTQDEKARTLEHYEEIKIQNENLDTMVKQLDEKIRELSQALSEKEHELSTLQQVELAVSTTNRELECLNKGLLKKVNDLENQINRHRDYQQIRDENAALTSQQNVLNQRLAQLENEKTASDELVGELQRKIVEEKARLEKEIDSSRSIIKDLNGDFEDRQKEIESLREEKAAWIAQQEVAAIKLSSGHESSSAKSNGKISNDENIKLQETNHKLLERLENFEKNSEKEISDMTQKIEDLTEKARLYDQVSGELVELKQRYEQLLDERPSKGKDSVDDSELAAVRAERDELAGRMKKILSEVEDVSNKNLFLEQKVENYLILEQSNERLKLINEKLSRQLDETLVKYHLM